MSSNIRLPSIPRSADRDTTVFLQAIKKAISTLASQPASAQHSAASRDYVMQLNKKTEQEIAAELEDSLGIGNLLDILNGKITSSELHKELGERIEKITSNENAISQERLDRVADVLAANDALIKERGDRVQAITDSSNLLQQNIDAEVIARTNAITETRDRVIAERDERVADVAAANTAIETESRNRIDAIIQANTAIGDERDARVAAITDEADKRVTENAVISETLNGVFAQVNPRMAGDTDWLAGDNIIQVGVWTEQSARIEDDFALGQRIDTLNAEFKGSNALIQTKQKTLADASQALAERTEVISAKTEDNAAAINIENLARTDLESSVSEQLAILTATTGANTASIEFEQTARTDADSALTEQVNSLVATTDNNSALIQSESQARADADSALTEQVNSLVATTEGHTAAIEDASEAMTTETTANARRIDGVYAQVNPRMAGDTDWLAGEDSPERLVGVWSERSAAIEKDFAMGQRVDGLVTAIDDNKATITQLDKTLVTKNEVVASQINRLAAQMTGGYDGDDLEQVTSGLIHQERTARATAVEGLAEQVSLLSAGVGEQFDSFEIWHFDKNRDGWVNGVYASGWINVRTETINSPVISVDGGMYRHVKLRIQKIGTPTWGAVLTYTGGSLGAPEPEYTEDGFAIVNFHLEWTGTITGFSIKLAGVADNLNYFKIDWIAVGRPSPGASHAALLREEKARADKDKALTQQFTSLDAQINGDATNASSSIVQKLDATASKTDTAAEDISNLTSTFNDEVMGSEGIVARNAQTAASASAANASDISGVFAQVNPRLAGDTDWLAGEDSPKNLAGAWSERSAQMEDNFATSQRFDAVLSEINGNKAAISLESKTRVDAIKTIAEQTETIRADFNKNAGVVQDQIKTVADDHSALVERTDTLQTTVGENTSSVQTAQKAIDGINAKWSIKTDVNGVVGGLGIANDGRTVDFIIRASNFAIAAIGGSSATPFVVTTEVEYLNGQRVPIGAYMDVAFIKNGSMTTAKIGHAQVDTLQLAGQAVIIPHIQHTAGSYLFYTIDTEEVINTLTLDAQGGPVSIAFGFEKLSAPINSRGANPTVYLRVRRDGVELRKMRLDKEGVSYAIEKYTSSSGDNDYSGTRLVKSGDGVIAYEYASIPTFFDEVPAGNHTYTVTLESRGLNAGKSSADQATNPVVITARALHIMGVKR